MDKFYRKIRMRGLDGSRDVYKYIPLKYLKILIKDSKLRIDKVTTWEDPYENFLLKNNFYTDTELYGEVPVSTEEVLERTYGQSWTSSKESDAMWRIYSKYTQNAEEKNISYLDEVAVRVKIKVDNLFDIVYTVDECMATTSIGEVEYLSDDKVNEFLDTKELTTNPNNIKWDTDPINCLYIKRLPFSHEAEVRIIILHDTEQQKEKFLSYDISDLSVFEEFILDPRLEDDEVTFITNELVQLGVDKGKVAKSSLYDFTPRRIKI